MTPSLNPSEDHNFSNHESATKSVHPTISNRKKNSKKSFLNKLNLKKNQVLALTFFGILVIGLLSVMVLIRLNSDTRQQASTGIYACNYSVCQAGYIQASNPSYCGNSCNPPTICCIPKTTTSPTPKISVTPVLSPSPSPVENKNICTKRDGCIQYILE